MNGTGIGEVRTKLLNTDHKQWNCGMGVFDPDVVFYKEDPNGYVIIDGKRCKLLTSPQYVYEKIGDKVYKTVKIGNLQWMAENLDYKWDGLLIGTEHWGGSYTDPVAAYREDDEATWGWNGRKAGLYYNKYALWIDENNLTKNLQGTGWRLPTYDEINALYDSLEDPDETTRIDKLFVPDCSWSQYEHPADAKMNETGLSLIPTAEWDDNNGEWPDLSLYKWATIVIKENRAFIFEAPNSTSYGSCLGSNVFPATVRLVKDV